MTNQPDKVLERILKRLASQYDPRKHGGFRFTAYKQGLGDYGAKEMGEDAEFYAEGKWKALTPSQQALERYGELELMRAEVESMPTEVLVASAKAAGTELENLLDEYVLGAEEIAARFGVTERTMRGRLKNKYQEMGIAKKIKNKWAMKNRHIIEQIKVEREKK